MCSLLLGYRISLFASSSVEEKFVIHIRIHRKSLKTIRRLFCPGFTQAIKAVFLSGLTGGGGIAGKASFRRSVSRKTARETAGERIMGEQCNAGKLRSNPHNCFFRRASWLMLLEQTKDLERATSRYVSDQAWFLIKAPFFLVI